MAINNETAKTEEKNTKLFLRDSLNDILAISREGKDLGFDTGVARDIFLNTVRHGKTPEGEAPEAKAIMEKLFQGRDFTDLKVKYDSQTTLEQQADIDDFAEAVREYYKTL